VISPDDSLTVGRLGELRISCAASAKREDTVHG
jgi:hypothetical protein